MQIENRQEGRGRENESNQNPPSGNTKKNCMEKAGQKKRKEKQDATGLVNRQMTQKGYSGKSGGEAE